VTLHANYKSWFVAISKNRTARYVLRIVLQSRDEFALLHPSSLICLFCVHVCVRVCVCMCVSRLRVFFAYTYICRITLNPHASHPYSDRAYDSKNLINRDTSSLHRQ